MWDGSVGATLKAPFVQTPRGTLSGPPGNIHLAGTAPFSFPLRQRGLVNTHHRAPPTCRGLYLSCPFSVPSSSGRTVAVRGTDGREPSTTPLSQKAAAERPTGRDEIWSDGAICTDATGHSLWPTRQQPFGRYCSFFLASPPPRSRQRAAPGRLTARSVVASKRTPYRGPSVLVCLVPGRGESARLFVTGPILEPLLVVPFCLFLQQALSKRAKQGCQKVANRAGVGGVGGVGGF